MGYKYLRQDSKKTKIIGTAKGQEYLGQQKTKNTWDSKGPRTPGATKGQEYLGQQRAKNTWGSKRPRILETAKSQEYLRQHRAMNKWDSKRPRIPGAARDQECLGQQRAKNIFDSSPGDRQLHPLSQAKKTTPHKHVQACGSICTAPKCFTIVFENSKAKCFVYTQWYLDNSPVCLRRQVYMQALIG